METIALAVASILAISAATAAATRRSTLRPCPICVGVASTWMWMLGARFAGAGLDPTVLAILLGGSVAGTVQLLEKRLPAGRSAQAFKTLFIPLGFVAAYGIAASDWLLFAVAAAGAFLLVGAFMRAAPAPGADSATIVDLERRMKDCC